MKHIAKMLTMYLLLSWLTACLNNKPVLTPTLRPTFLSTASVLQTETRNATEANEVADASFITRSITVESATVAAADFDHDGYQDLVSAGEPRLTIFRGDGKGGLFSFSQVPGGEQPDGFALTDLDEDGDIDIVIANHDTDYLTLLLGNGDGAVGWRSSISKGYLPGGEHPWGMAVIDFNGDGKDDMVIGDDAAHRAIVYLSHAQ